MFKVLSATALSATIALATLAPTPALAADQDDVARFLLGAGFLAILAAAVNEHNDKKDKKDREVHKHKHVTKVIKKPVRQVQKVQPVRPRQVEVQRQVQQRPRQVEVHRVVPNSCARTFRTENGNRSFLTRICMEDAGIRTANLPNQCERVLDMPGDRENRRVWNQSCLQNHGYRVR